MSEQEQARPRPPWFDLAARVLRLAMAGQFDRAGTVIVRMQAAHGSSSLIGAMNAWMDTALTRSGATAHQRPLSFVEARTGRVVTELSPAADWTARLMQARRDLDEPAYQEVFAELTAENLNTYLTALLQVCASMVRYDQLTLARAAVAQVPVGMIPRTR